MEGAISIVLVDDHTLVRAALKSLIEVLGNYKIIAEFDNGKQFIEGVPSLPHTDLVIMDLDMPEMSGEQAVIWLRQYKPDLKVLILTLDTFDRLIIELYRMGVRGYLPKSCSAEELKQAIDSIINTGYYHTDLLPHALASDGLADKPQMPNLSLISDRELTFVQLICDPKEYTYDQIATIMNVSKRTVDGYREMVNMKFGTRSKTGLLLFAIKHRLVRL